MSDDLTTAPKDPDETARIVIHSLGECFTYETCENCLAEITILDKICPFCGVKLVGSTKLEEETAKVDVTVTDGGDFGFNSCGKCGGEVDGHPDRCPHCGIKLVDTYITPSFGGSDF
jgi:predicted amidophosphoribosyltransferase